MSFNAVKSNDVLFDRFRRKKGNTTLSMEVSLPVRVEFIDHALGEAFVSRNGGTVQRYSVRQIERLFRTPHKARAHA